MCFVNPSHECTKGRKTYEKEQNFIIGHFDACSAHDMLMFQLVNARCR